MLSCCMIVKDEATLLPGCLASVATLVDETVLVDTGSCDGTPEIARAAGARVFHLPFADDFSAPRNLAVQKAEGQWVLVLDADERLSPGSVAVIRAAIQEGGFDYGMLVLHNANHLDATTEDVLQHGAVLEPPQLITRLYRRCDELRWEGIIHENTHAWALRGPKRGRALDRAAIVHYGAVPSYRTQRRKDERNLRLLQKRCESSPRDSAARRYLASTLHGMGLAERAASEISEAWRLLRAQMAGLGREDPQPGSVSIATLHANYLRHRGEPELAIGVLELALHWNVGHWDEGHPNLYMQLGACLETISTMRPSHPYRSRFLARARQAYHHCLAQSGKLFCEAINPDGCTGLVALVRLGTVNLLLGDGMRACAAFAQAIALQPDHLEARLGHAEAELMSERADACFREARLLFDDAPPDAYTLAAAACYEAGTVEPVFALVRQALASLRERPFLAAHRHARLAAVCNGLREHRRAADTLATSA